MKAWQVNELGVFEISDIGLLAVVTLPSGPGALATVNLQAPLVINFKTRCAKQLVTGDEQFAVRQPVDLSCLVA